MNVLARFAAVSCFGLALLGTGCGAAESCEEITDTCGCYAREDCRMVTTACWCAAECDQETECACGGGEFLRCEAR